MACYDAGVDTDLTNGSTSASLPSDGPLAVLVLVSIPVGAAPNATSKVELTATSTTGTGTPGTLFAGAGIAGGDAVVGASTALATAQATLTVNRTVVALVKSATVADPFGGVRPVPSAIITYRIVADGVGHRQRERPRGDRRDPGRHHLPGGHADARGSGPDRHRGCGRGPGSPLAAFPSSSALSPPARSAPSPSKVKIN